MGKAKSARKSKRRARERVEVKARPYEACVTNARWNGGKWIRHEKRHAIYARDKHTCAYCRRHESELDELEELQLDHVVSRERGGGNHEANLVTACSTCNRKKGRATLATFARALAAELHRSHNAILRRVANLTSKPLDRALGAELYALKRAGASF